MMETKIAAYQGAVAQPSLGMSETTGEVRVAPYGLEFVSATASWTIPFARLVIDLAPGQRLRFTDPGQPDLAFLTREDRILAHAILRQQPHLRERIVEIRTALERRAMLKVAGLLAIALAGLGVTLWILGRLAVGFISQRVPVAWEVAMGEAVARQIEPRLKTVANPGYDRMLDAVVRRLTNAMPASPYAFQLRVVEDELPNAFALPGGRIFVHSGLMKSARQPEEVAGVIAHEMAHVNLRHGLRLLINSSVPRFLFRVFIGDQQGFATLAGEASQTLLQQRYSRDAERQADQTGWQYLLDARIDPRGLIAFFKALAADPRLPQTTHPALQLFASHPLTADRIEYLESLWEASPRKTGFEGLSPSEGHSGADTRIER